MVTRAWLMMSPLTALMNVCTYSTPPPSVISSSLFSVRLLPALMKYLPPVKAASYGWERSNNYMALGFFGSPWAEQGPLWRGGLVERILRKTVWGCVDVPHLSWWTVTVFLSRAVSPASTVAPQTLCQTHRSRAVEQDTSIYCSTS